MGTLIVGVCHILHFKIHAHVLHNICPFPLLQSQLISKTTLTANIKLWTCSTKCFQRRSMVQCTLFVFYSYTSPINPPMPCLRVSYHKAVVITALRTVCCDHISLTKSQSHWALFPAAVTVLMESQSGENM